jgi:hypothetical protein
MPAIVPHCNSMRSTRAFMEQLMMQICSSPVQALGSFLPFLTIALAFMLPLFWSAAACLPWATKGRRFSALTFYRSSFRRAQPEPVVLRPVVWAEGYQLFRPPQSNHLTLPGYLIVISDI